ncbi:transposase [Crocosphaera watsonii WH 8501]|uniref:transposase n=1 Tax=Crocosphaera watsonii TaxID=263511 RepID=UPI0009D6B715|nr:transposase [Crocosphaera watsonii]
MEVDIRTITKKSTAKCHLELYTYYLIAESKYSGRNRLSEIFEDLSHDSVNRFLLRESYKPVDLFNEFKQHIELSGGTLSIDDTVIEKLYSNPKLSKFIGYFWSGNKHKTIKGINLVTLLYTDPNGISVPLNYRLYDKEDNLSKNDYFRMMLSEVLAWGLRPIYVTGDSWYSSKENLKFLKKQELGFMIGIAKNRQVSIVKGQY